ncbi:MAG: RNA methyltransferase [Erysipelotrichaceae bacterium]|nr:RNA methyltransferase [Erysipelotrichaceae bacterium]
MQITSLQNQYVKQLVKLHQKKYRDQDTSFIVEGAHLVEEAFQAGLIKQLIVRIGCLPAWPIEDIVYVSDEVMKKLTATVSLADVAAVCQYRRTDKQLSKRIVMLDNVQDPGNVGTIIRTALSFDFHDVILSPDSADIYNEKVIRSSQGAIFKMNVFHENLLTLLVSLKSSQYQIYGTALKNAVNLSQTVSAEKLVLIFGNEGQGINPEILRLTDTNLFIEMQNFESLNVAVAAGICLYHFRQR